ncbi:hypothetical protein [Marinivivus vitaminiproducens]|uniref:hypothetical protein n=1 Tax=Marinivivus vitaminiproducens TaxID=3035935 RepID=UPI00279CA460|nr:hypothetical protein P4R82_12885 [Geminicoccaceae bacterium SCSIO 64248]
MPADPAFPPDRAALRPHGFRFRFRPRRCRRRVAQALAAGRDPAAIARIERIGTDEIEALVGEAGFDLLVGHYRELAALAYDDRIARLAGLALEILELGLEAGDLKLAMFVLHERAAGRDPARGVAVRAVARIEAAATREAPRPDPRARDRLEARAPARRAEPWDDQATMQRGQDRAEAHGLDLLRRVVPGLAGRTLAALAERLTGEAERFATGRADRALQAREDEARAVAGHLYHACPPSLALNAQLRLQVRQDARAFGRPDAVLEPVPDPPPHPEPSDRHWARIAAQRKALQDAHWEAHRAAARAAEAAARTDGVADPLSERPAGPSAGPSRDPAVDPLPTADVPGEPGPPFRRPRRRGAEPDELKALIAAIAPAPPAREPPGPPRRRRSPRAGPNADAAAGTEALDSFFADAARFLARERARRRPR